MKGSTMDGEIWSVDRIEAGVAVLEDQQRRHLSLPVEQLPEGAREGDCLRRSDKGGFLLDSEETARRKARARDLFRSLTQAE